LKNNRQSSPSEILLVDDTPEQIETAVAALRQNNNKVRIASKGQTALRLIKQHAPDLILLDVYMPEMDGFEVCKAIKEDPDLNSIPIIFLTASNDEESIKRGFELGAQDYVIKPFNISELLARVNTHIALKQQTESLKEANRELDSFCYSVSHDLKAPLLSIQKLIDYFEADYRDKMDDDGHELLVTIREKSTEVVDIVDHLLELSKMSEMQMKKEPIPLEKLFRDVFDELMKNETNRQVRFCHQQLPVINGDPLMIKLLVQNVLSNAIKYTRNEETTIIKVFSSENDIEYIISIEDNGVGFNMMYSSRLFGIFQRLHSQSEFEGTGVGLSICQRILKRHSGSAWMTGEEGRGATFHFSFPK
jgi:two-component system sensor histidine kinase/response regulator